MRLQPLFLKDPSLERRNAYFPIDALLVGADEPLLAALDFRL